MLEVIPGIATSGMSAAQSMAPSFLQQLGTFGKDLWSNIGGMQGLTKLGETGAGLWGTYNQAQMNDQLMKQMNEQTGMQKEAFNRDKQYQDALKSIDWTA